MDHLDGYNYTYIRRCADRWRKKKWRQSQAARFMEDTLKGRASVTETLQGCPSFFDLKIKIK